MAVVFLDRVFDVPLLEAGGCVDWDVDVVFAVEVVAVLEVELFGVELLDADVWLCGGGAGAGAPFIITVSVGEQNSACLSHATTEYVPIGSTERLNVNEPVPNFDTWLAIKRVSWSLE